MNSLQVLLLFWILSYSSCSRKYFPDGGAGVPNKLISNFRSELGVTKANYDIINQDTHAKISFKVSRLHTQVSYTEQLNYADWMASAFFCENLWGSYSYKNRAYKHVGQVSIGDVQIPALERNGYMIMTANSEQSAKFNSMLGKTIKFAIDGSISSGYSPQTTELYIPKPLNPGFNNVGLSFGGREAVKRNSSFQLTWDADVNNTKGFILTIENGYKIDTAGTTDITSQIKYACNTILMEDDGIYTFQPADFDGIPDGHELLFTITRGNVLIVDNNDKKVKLYGGEEIFIQQFVLMP